MLNWGRTFAATPGFCPLRLSSPRSMEHSLSCGWRCWSREGRVCLSMELFISSGPPNIGVRSRDAAFLSVGGTMLRVPGIRFCPWQGGGSGGGGRSVPQQKHRTVKPWIPHALSVTTNISLLTNVTFSSQNNNRCFTKTLHELLKTCLPLATHHLHPDLSCGVLCPGFGVCVWVWWPSGGPGCVCRLCCHLLRRGCWAGPGGTSLYLQGGPQESWLTEARRTELVASKTQAQLIRRRVKEAFSWGWRSLEETPRRTHRLRQI